MLACSDLVRTESDLSHPLCLSKHVLPSCAMDLYFIDLCKLRCILNVVSNYLEQIYVSSIRVAQLKHGINMFCSPIC
jgi:hypothetical protein